MIEIFINGQPAGLAALQFQAQDDPYPGGLRYEIRGEDADLAGYLSERFRPGEYGPLATSEAEWVFMGLQLARMVQQMGLPAPEMVSSYFLNTVEKLALSGSSVAMRGAASPVWSGSP